MSDELVLEAPRATIFFGRKVTDGNYGSSEAGIHFPVDLTGDEAVDEANLQHAFTLVKAHVYKQLLIESVISNDVVVEKVEAAFPNSTQVAAPRGNFKPVTSPASGNADASGDPHPVFGTCKDCGGTAFYDNREKKASGQYKANAADGKCRGCNKGVWFNKK